MSRVSGRLWRLLVSAALVALFVPAAPAGARSDAPAPVARVTVEHRVPETIAPVEKPSPIPSMPSEAPRSGAAAVVSASVASTLTATNTTWSGSVVVREDVIVPAGKTLTVLPGTRIYFDVAASGNGTPGTPDNPSDLVDLVVHGKLIAKGTSTARILFTSIRSLPASATSDSLPRRGDWGQIFTDSKAASELSYVTIEHGSMIKSQGTSRPYITNCTVQSMTFNPAALLFERPVTDATTPRIIISDNRFDSADVLIRWESTAGDSGDRSIDPLITGNTAINSGFRLKVGYVGSAPTAFGTSTVKGTIKSNKVYNTGDEPFILEADSGGTGSAIIGTAFSYNTLVNDDDNAVDVDARTKGTGSAIVAPTFYKDNLTPWNSCFDGRAFVDLLDANNPGRAEVRPKFSYCTLASAQDDAVWLEARANGKGEAKVAPVFVGGTLDHVYNHGIYAFAVGHYGAGTVAPSLTNLVATGGTSPDAFLYGLAVSNTTGEAVCSPALSGGSIVQGAGRGMDLRATSEDGPASCAPVVEGTVLTAPDWPIVATANARNVDGGNDDATLAGSVIVSELRAPGTASALYGQAIAGGTGDALVSTASEYSTFVSDDAFGVELFARSGNGGATNRATFEACEIEGMEDALTASAVRTPSDSTSATVLAQPRLTTYTTVTSKYSDALVASAENAGTGIAKSAPYVSRSELTSVWAGRGARVNAQLLNEASGAAQALPYFYQTDVVSSETGVFLNSSTVSGAISVTRGTFRGCTVDSALGSGIEAVAGSASGPAECAPLVESCDIWAVRGYGVSSYAAGVGDAATIVLSAPSVNGGRIWASKAAGVSARADSASETTTETIRTEPKVTSCPIACSAGAGVEALASTPGNGDAVANALVQASPINAARGVQAHAVCSGEGSALNTSKVLGTSSASRTKIEARSGRGVDFLAQAATGSAEDWGEAKYLRFDTLSNAVLARAYATSPGGDSVERTVVAGNSIGTKWQMDREVFEIASDAAGGSALLAPVVSSNTSPYNYQSGISLKCNGSTGTTVSPTVTGNAILQSTGEGIVIDATRGYAVSGGSAAGTDSVPAVTKNVVEYPSRGGIELYGIPAGTVQQNRVVGAGAGAWVDSNYKWHNTSGIYWTGATRAALVKGNMIVGSRYGVAYEGESPVTQYNSFGDCVGGAVRPFNYFTSASDSATPTPAFDARFNWWGTALPSAIDESISHPLFSGPTTAAVDYSGALPSCQPRVTKIVVSKTSTKVKFTVTFDRPMDKAITTLKFAVSSPYSKYAVKGSWNSAGTVFTGTRSRSGLPTGKTMYFSGAKDLPGNLMYSKSKGFKL